VPQVDKEYADGHPNGFGRSDPNEYPFCPKPDRCVLPRPPCAVPPRSAPLGGSAAFWAARRTDPACSCVRRPEDSFNPFNPLGWMKLGCEFPPRSLARSAQAFSATRTLSSHFARPRFDASFIFSHLFEFFRVSMMLVMTKCRPFAVCVCVRVRMRSRRPAQAGPQVLHGGVRCPGPFPHYLLVNHLLSVPRAMRTRWNARCADRRHPVGVAANHRGGHDRGTRVVPSLCTRAPRPLWRFVLQRECYP
jgi:hypothetical protein